MIEESKNVQTTPLAPTARAISPCPTIIQIVGRPGTGSLPRTIAPPDHPSLDIVWHTIRPMYLFIGMFIANHVFIQPQNWILFSFVRCLKTWFFTLCKATTLLYVLYVITFYNPSGTIFFLSMDLISKSVNVAWYNPKMHWNIIKKSAYNFDIHHLLLWSPGNAVGLALAYWSSGLNSSLARGEIF